MRLVLCGAIAAAALLTAPISISPVEAKPTIFVILILAHLVVPVQRP